MKLPPPFNKFLTTTLMGVVCLLSIFTTSLPASCNTLSGINPNSTNHDSIKRQISYYGERDLDSAFLIANKALELSKGEKDRKMEAIYLVKLAYLNIKLQKFDTALALIQESHKIRESLGDLQLVQSSYIHLSNIYISLKQFEKAQEEARVAFNLATNEGDSAGQFNALTQLGIIAGKTLKLEECKSRFIGAYNLAKKINSQSLIMRSAENLGIAYKNLSQYDSAYRLLYEIYEYYQRVGGANSQAGLETNLGNLLLRMNKPDSAIMFLKRGYHHALELGHQQFQSTALSALHQYYGDHNESDSAYHFLLLYLKLKEDIYGEELAKGIATAEVKFETERIQLKNKIQQQQIEKDNRTKKILLSTLIAVLIAALLVLRNIQQKRKLAEKDAELQRQKIDKLLQKHEMKIFEAMVNGQEEERHRIAEDLHDRLGSILSAIKLHFNGIEEILNKNNISRPKQVEKTHQMLDVASQEVRSISHDMLSNTLVKFGLVPALNDLSETIVTSGQLEMEIFEHGLSNRLDNKVEITIYRVVQELVANILKHAEASKITIELNVIDGQLNLIVHDDGKGFDSEKHLSIGVGLQNVRNRLSTIGGEMIIDSKPNKGTSTIIEIQLNQDHD